MKADIAQQWAEALKSGEYQQGSGSLRRVNTEAGEDYCCLGVLCELHKKAVGGTWVRTSSANFEYHPARAPNYSGYLGASTSYLPIAVVDWAGIKVGSPLIRSKIATEYFGQGEVPLPYTLAQINDGDICVSEEVDSREGFKSKMPFSLIADVILETQEEI